MNFFKVSLAALAATSSLALADPPPGPPPGGRGGTPSIERLAADLGLDDSQKVLVKQIFDDKRAEMDAERQQFEASGTRPTREEMQAKRKVMETDLRAQLSGVLSAEQLKKFDELQKQHRRSGPPGGPPPEESQAQ